MTHILPLQPSFGQRPTFSAHAPHITHTRFGTTDSDLTQDTLDALRTQLVHAWGALRNTETISQKRKAPKPKYKSFFIFDSQAQLHRKAADRPVVVFDNFNQQNKPHVIRVPQYDPQGRLNRETNLRFIISDANSPIQTLSRSNVREEDLGVSTFQTELKPNNRQAQTLLETLQAIESDSTGRYYGVFQTIPDREPVLLGTPSRQSERYESEQFPTLVPASI